MSESSAAGTTFQGLILELQSYCDERGVTVAGLVGRAQQFPPGGERGAEG